MNRDEVRRGAQEAGVSVRELGVTELEDAYALLRTRYDMAGEAPLWEQLTERASLQSPEAWMLVREFVGARPCILLLDPCDQQAGFEFQNGDALHRVLENTYQFEFYVVDRTGAYLICFNHHDMLLAAGEARSWLEHRVDK